MYGNSNYPYYDYSAASITMGSWSPLSPWLYNKTDEELFNLLVGKHHGYCDFLRRSNETIINGLYACQFANISGPIYNQYLRYKREMEAYKTKLCRKYHHIDFCLLGSSCPYVHDFKQFRNVQNNGYQSGIEVCAIYQYSGGFCPYMNNCRYAHKLGLAIPRQQPPYYDNNNNVVIDEFVDWGQQDEEMKDDISFDEVLAFMKKTTADNQPISLLTVD